jgi:hypothetical protein
MHPLHELAGAVRPLADGSHEGAELSLRETEQVGL